MGRFSVIDNVDCQVERKSYRFSELRPVRTLKCGVGIYDKSSFPGQYPVEQVDVPYDPQVLIVDSLKVSDRNGNSIDAGRANVLTVHGQSSNSDWGTVIDNRRISNIVASIERDGMSVDYLHVCNSGGYRLPLIKGKNPLSYPLDVSNGSIVFDETGLSANLRSDRIRIKGRTAFQVIS